MKLSHIIINGFFTLCFFSMTYYLLERLRVVPTLTFWDGIGIPDTDLVYGFNITRTEAVVIFTITFIISWVVSSIIYWRYIGREKIEW
ncbi:MAG: hypothetical protein ACTSR3_01220 [Candidatus Helarchaeota archaeon]